MRKLFFLIFLAGAGLTFGYPWYVENLTGYEIGTFPAYRPNTGYTPVSVLLSSNGLNRQQNRSCLHPQLRQHQRRIAQPPIDRANFPRPRR